MSIPITRLKKWDYKREYQIFRDLYKATRKTEWIRIPALIATEKCIAIRTAALVGTIAGLTFKVLDLSLLLINLLNRGSADGSFLRMFLVKVCI